MKRFLLKFFPLLTAMLLFLVMPMTVNAAEFRVGTENNENVTINADEELTNLYAAGNLVTVNADITKSLYAGGNVVTINGDVENDLKAGAGTLLLQGDVGGSAHLGAGTVVIEGKITDDLFVGGGTVTITDTAEIDGDLFVGGGVVDIQGPVKGNVWLGAGQATINSTVGGNVRAEVDTLELGDMAMITGDLKYSAPTETELKDEAQVAGMVDYTKLDQEKFAQDHDFRSKKTFSGMAVGIWLIKVTFALISSFTIFLVMGKLIELVAKETKANFWQKTGLGFVLAVMVPVTSLILLITILGAWMAGLSMMIFGLLMMLAKATANILFGLWVMKLVTKKEVKLNWKVVALGAVLLPTVRLVPVLGFFVGCTFMLASFGTYYTLAYQKLLKK